MMENLLKELYEFYWEIKSSVALYEIRENTIPADLLNELRNSFDHVARCYHFYDLGSHSPDEKKIESHLVKARSHLERLHLDLYKNFIVKNIDRINTFTQRVEDDLNRIKERPYPLPDVTQFQTWFNAEHSRVKNIVLSAKIDECAQKGHTEKIELLSKALICQEEFIDRCNSKYGNLQPCIAEAIDIMKKDCKQYRIATYVVPVISLIISLIVGYFLGKFL